MAAEKRAPVQGYAPGIPWSLHLEAYAVYCKKWGPQPALVEGWCRGGFHTDELDEFVPGWRERAAGVSASDGKTGAAQDAPRYYCNKCGSFPTSVQHKRPDGSECPYIARVVA